MRGPIVHGALLVVALVLAYQSWTRDKTEEKKVGKVKVWSKDAVAKITFDTKDRTLMVERKGEGGDTWLWGSESRVSKVRKKPAGEGTPAEPEFENKTTVKEFPVGDQGKELFDNFADLRALRDLGVLEDDEKERYGIAESTDNITISFADGDKSLILGGKIYGSSDRYILDVTSGRGYAIAGAVVASLTGGESSLRLSKLHKFEDDKLQQVLLAAGSKELTVVRTESADPKTKGGKGWASSATPDKPDQTLANFLEHLKGLRPTAYTAEIEGPALEPVMTADWRDANGKSLGKLEVYKQVIPPPPEPETPPTPPGGVPPAPVDPKAPAGAKPADPKAPAGAKPADPKAPVAPTKPPAPEPDGHGHDPAGGEAKQPAAGAPVTPPAGHPKAPAKPATPPVGDPLAAPRPGKPGATPAAKPGDKVDPKALPPAHPPVVAPPKPKEPTVEYYVKSELTRIYGKIGKGQGERIEKDLKELLP